MRKLLGLSLYFLGEPVIYIEDGCCPISNNLEERVIRSFTIKRNNSLHFKSDENAEIASVYHT